MKNKRGFTLIELLAVIVILSLIMSIAIISIGGVVEDTRYKVFNATALNVIDSVRKYLTINDRVEEGEYFFKKNIVEKGLDESPLGGIFAVGYENCTSDSEIGEKICKMDEKTCIDTTISYVQVIKDDNGKYEYGICLTAGEGNYYLKLVKERDLLNGNNLAIIGNAEENTDEENSSYICKRTTDVSALHTEICDSGIRGSGNYSDWFCRADGYALYGTITYGNAKPLGSALAVGDAFDCKVSENGGYTERFYYVSPYYNTRTQTFDNTTATLIYYSNTINGVASDSGSAYATRLQAQSLGYTCSESNGCNWYGPISAVGNLPTTSQWSNVKLKTEIRKIWSCNDGDCSTPSTSANGETIKNLFIYTDKAARLLTILELKQAGCDTLSGKTSLKTVGSLKACNFLFEGTLYADSTKTTNGPWLENPRTNDYGVFGIGSYGRLVAYEPPGVNSFGTRPVIDVPYSKLEY